jgi:hypothetical protein
MDGKICSLITNNMKEKILKVVAVSYAIMTMMLVCISRIDLACIFGIVSMVSALELTHIKIKK